jgi:hypothetical protein
MNAIGILIRIVLNTWIAFGSIVIFSADSANLWRWEVVLPFVVFLELFIQWFVVLLVEVICIFC